MNFDLKWWQCLIWINGEQFEMISIFALSMKNFFYIYMDTITVEFLILIEIYGAENKSRYETQTTANTFKCVYIFCVGCLFKEICRWFCLLNSRHTHTCIDLIIFSGLDGVRPRNTVRLPLKHGNNNRTIPSTTHMQY